MRNSSFFKMLLILLLICGCTSLIAQTSQGQDSQEAKERFPGRGLQIVKVFEDSPAEQAGLKTMDIIFRYGDFEILDDASFFAARDTYEHSGKSEIPILIWRGGKAVRAAIRPGRVGIESNEYSPVASKFDSIMMRLDVQREIPEFMRAVEFKDTYEPPDQIVNEAKRLIDQAEREGTLTPNQILVARIYVITDDAPPEDLKQQSAMLAQLISTQPVSYMHVLGNDHFFLKKHNRAAVECLKRYLEAHPDDATIRLNMGVAYYRLRMFAEAEAAADYVLEHQLKLSNDDLALAYNVKAMGVLGRGDYAGSISFAEKAFDAALCHCNISLVMLAAAETGDLQKLAEASNKFQEELPEEFGKKGLQLAAVEALALVKANQRDRARELVQKWKETDRVEGRLKAYWKIYACGSDVWNNWNELART
jgi:hypothetical protein